MTEAIGQETATFGGGCFWCTEAVFTRLAGVSRVTSGYSGGHVDDPSYEQICTGNTGHAEVIQIKFDKRVIAYSDLLDVFFQTHDPTTLNRQGADVGTQYRSVIFHHSEAQRDTAEATVARLNASGAYRDPIVTEITPAVHFYPAEGYHQDYFDRNMRQPYCIGVIQPKVDKLESKFADKLKS